MIFDEFEKVSPACAGMIPEWQDMRVRAVGEPRMRGDDPTCKDIPREIQK